MPSRKYYCDYCDKQFEDTPFHRKRHLQSLYHQKSKAIWYASIPPPPPGPQSTTAAAAVTVAVCNRFIQTGSCPYADSCRHFHPPSNSMEMQFPISRIISGGVMLGNLPPSLRPPPEGGYPPLPFVDWG